MVMPFSVFNRDFLFYRIIVFKFYIDGHYVTLITAGTFGPTAAELKGFEREKLGFITSKHGS